MASESDKGGYVGRGGLKLEAALGRLGGREAIENAKAIDIGASTGGFTECLLRHGAREVTALEVGHSQLHEKLKADPRVINLEKTNFKTVSLKVAPGPFDYFVVDVSFVAARTMLRPLAFRLRPGAEGVILVKPQFELSEGYVKDGLVKAEGLRTWALNRVKKKGEALGFVLLGSVDSPVELESGTVEILTRWRFNGKTQLLTDPRAARKAKPHPRPAPIGKRNWRPAPGTPVPARPPAEPAAAPVEPAKPPAPRPMRPVGKIPYDQKRPQAAPQSRAERRRGEFGKPGARREAMPFEVPAVPPRPRDARPSDKPRKPPSKGSKPKR